MDDLARHSELELARLGGLKARADGKDHVGRLEKFGHARLGRKCADAERVVFRDASASVCGGHDWCTERFSELHEVRRGPGRDHASASPDHDLLRLVQQIDCRGHGSLVRRDPRPRFDVRDVDLGARVLDIDRHFDRAGLRAAGADLAGDAHDGLTNVLGTADGFGNAGDGAEHGDLVFRLVQHASALAVEPGVHLTGDHQDRRRCEAGFEQARHAVAGAGPRARDRDAELAGGARVAVRGVDCALFVAH